jgi:NDP-sugar pyrophosphorylase family protein
MKAVILAGGKGTRLAPYTTVLPKPLMPVGDMPILEITLRQLKYFGVTEFVLCVGHMASLLQAYFGDGRRLGVSISYSLEEEPLGTAGPIGLLPPLDDTFIVTNGDLLTTIDYAAMVQFHKRHGEMATIGLANKTVKIDLGVIETEGNGRVSAYIEKPVLNYKVSMGIYVFEPEIVERIKGRGRLDLPDLVKGLIAEGKSPAGFDSQCRWLDIGRVDDYSVATETFERDRALYLRS